MSSEWLSVSSTVVTALAGMGSTVFVAMYITRSNARNAAAERRHAAQQNMLAERKTAYEKMLQSFEESDDTLYRLCGDWRGGYGAGVNFTHEARALLDRNSKADLAIQDLERELELIAPLKVVRSCRVTFRTLRKKTKILVDEGVVSAQPYNSHLAETVLLMRADLDRLRRPNLEDEDNASTDGTEEEFNSLYGEWLAPENALSRQG